jgi:hypothetical protein
VAAAVDLGPQIGVPVAQHLEVAVDQLRYRTKFSIRLNQGKALKYVSEAVEMVALRLGRKRLVAMGGTAKTQVLTGLFS